MPKPTEPLDDLPILEPRGGRVSPERVPTPTFKSAVLRSRQLFGRGGRGSRSGGGRGGHPNRGSYAAAVRRPGATSRRVVVKARYVKMDSQRGIKAAKLHLKYIEREGVSREGGPGDLYSAKDREVDAKAFLERSEGDPHQFRFIVSPEEGAELDLREYARDLMTQVEQDLGRDLDWVGVNHYNTDNPHLHIVIRGRDRQGDELRMDRDYIANGFRDRARELATRELGQRLDYEIDRGLRREVTQERWTSLDYQIEKVSHEKLIDQKLVELGEPGSQVSTKMDRFIVGRLNHLQTLGLANSLGARRYVLDTNYQATLRTLGERGDIIKTMHRGLSRDVGHYHIHDASQDKAPLVGRLTRKGLHDELNDRYYAVVETPNGHASYVVLPKHTDFDALREGSTVAVTSVADPWLKLSDGVIQDHAAGHDGVYRVDEHIAALTASRQFMQRNIDPVDYARAHERRAQRLARFGLLTKSDTGFAVPDNLEAQLTKLDREQPNPRTVRLTVKDSRTLENQVAARGPAWIDEVADGAAGVTGFGGEVRDARRRRIAFLEQSLGLDASDAGLTDRLARVERNELAATRAASSGKREHPLAPGVTSRGRLVAKLDAPSGAQYGVLETEKEFSLVPWRDRFQKSLNRNMTFGMDRSGRPFVRALTPGLSR